MILMTAVFHAYVKRNGLHSNSDVELFDMLELIDEIITDLEEQLNHEKDEAEYSKKKEIIEALRVIRKSRNRLAHNNKYCQLAEVTEWTESWIKAAEYLLANTRRSLQQAAQDDHRIQQLKKACDAVKNPGRRDQNIKDSFRFALAETSYAKAARAYFIQTTIVHPALKECAALHVSTQGQEKNKDISDLLSILLNKSSYTQGRDTFSLKKMFFGKENGSSPEDVDGDGIKECRNILAHNTECSIRKDTKYIEMLSLWKRCLNELNSRKEYHQRLSKAAKYLFGAF